MATDPDKEAEELLPCKWGPNLVNCRSDEKICENCERRPAVVEALRKRDEEIKKLQAVFDSVAPTNSQGYQGLLGTGQRLIDLEFQLADEKAVRIVKENILDTVLGDREALRSQLAALRAELAALKAKVKNAD